jgi:hypothetical protein
MSRERGARPLNQKKSLVPNPIEKQCATNNRRFASPKLLKRRTNTYHIVGKPFRQLLK